MEVERAEAAEEQAAFCRVFGSSKRVLILWTLSGQERAVGEIAAAIGASLQNTSQHLHFMKAAGVLTSRRDGQTIYYRLAKNAFARTCGLISQVKKGDES
jgi:ArsR family transcriptional regulator, virulence genes transcriptional regulator